MATLVYGLNQSLDGYVDHDGPGLVPDPVLFRHFIEHEGRIAGSIYGRVMYEIMRVWDEDDPNWNAEEREYAMAWRRAHKWVVSRTLKSVGPNATLVDRDLEGTVRRLKAELDGELEVAGPKLAGSLMELGLVDVYRIYLHPVVFGKGNPYFASARPRLRLTASERIGSDVIRLSYVPA